MGIVITFLVFLMFTYWHATGLVLHALGLSAFLYPDTPVFSENSHDLK